MHVFVKLKFRHYTSWSGMRFELPEPIGHEGRRYRHSPVESSESVENALNFEIMSELVSGLEELDRDAGRECDNSDGR